MNTNALRGIKVRMDIDLRDLRFVVPNKTSFLGQCLYYCLIFYIHIVVPRIHHIAVLISS